MASATRSPTIKKHAHDPRNKKNVACVELLRTVLTFLREPMSPVATILPLSLLISACVRARVRVRACLHACVRDASTAAEGRQLTVNDV